MAVNKDFVVKNGLQVGANTSIEGSITTVDSIQFDTSAAATVGPGILAWNADAGTLDLGIDNDVTLQLGQETTLDTLTVTSLTADTLTVTNTAITNVTSDVTFEQNVSIDGNLIISGNTTSVNTNNLVIEDLNIVLAQGAVDASAADGAGITIDGANAQLTYTSADDSFNFNKDVNVTGGIEATANSSLMGVTFKASGATRAISTHSSSGQLQLNGGTDNTNGAFINIAGDGYGSGDFISVYAGTTYITGNTGIGVVNPAHKLDVNGDINSTSLITTTANTTTLNATTVNATTLNGAFGNTAVKVASSYPVTPATGNIWFDNLNLTLKVYDGSNWQDAVPSGGGGDANNATTDANATFAKYTYDLASATSVVSGVDANGNTLSYDTSGIENVEVYVNGVKQVEGAGFDYTASTGSSIGFTTTLSVGDVVDIQVYELLTNDAYYLKTETYTQTETNSQITTALGDYVPAAGGTFSGAINFSKTTGLSTLAVTSNALTIGPIDDYNLAFDPNEIQARNNGSENSLVLNKNGGNVSIGVDTSPARRLTITPEGNEPAVLIQHSGDQGNASTIEFTNGYTQKFVIGMDDTYASRDFVIVETSSGSSTDTENPKYVFNGNGDGVFHITDAADGDIKVKLSTNGDSYLIGGNLGIGTDAPATRLHVATNSNVNVGMRVETGLDDNNQSDPIGIQLWQPAGDLTSSISLSYSLGGAERAKIDGTRGGTGSGGHLRFYTQSGGSTTHFITLNESGHFLPATSTQDLGSTTNPWQNIYTQDLVLSNEARPEGNEVDGTKGNWTIQEGEEHLYIINNKSGKKYKFALEEIE